MAIPKTNLDDRAFAELVEESIKTIPAIAPEWTDHNRHDPGITLIELFSWLTEMQHFYLNQIPDANKIKYLKLLGIKLREALSAKANVTFSLAESSPDEVFLPSGLPLLVENENIVFETTEPLNVHAFALKRVITSENTGLINNTDANNQVGLSYFAFGEEAKLRSRLNLGFEGRGGQSPFTAGETIRITFDLFEDYRDARGNPVKRGAHGEEPPEIIPSAVIKWEYFHPDSGSNTNGNWLPLDLTAELDQIFRAGLRGIPVKSPLCANTRKQLSELVKTLQTIPAAKLERVQQMIAAADTARELEELFTDPAFLNLKEDETLMLSQSGRIAFKIPPDFRVSTPPALGNDELFWIRATVIQPGYELPPQIDTVLLHTVAAVQQKTLSEILEFSSDGTENQVFEANTFLAIQGALHEDGLNIVQVQERDGTWFDWIRKNNFDDSGPLDPHFRLEVDAAQRQTTLHFGDNLRGKIPPEGKNSIRLISYAPEFDSRRLQSINNDLPGQRFSLAPLPVILESLAIQIAEMVEPPLEIRQSKELACLVEFERITPAFVLPGNTLEVRIIITAKQDFCKLELEEFLAADNDQLLATFAEGEIRSGQKIVLPPYQVTLGEDWKGGAISGKITLFPNRSCSSVTENTPVSVVGAQEPDAQSTIRWRDWIKVDDFDGSGPGDYHYKLSGDSEAIEFGDGINGAIPAVLNIESFLNIRLISYRTGGGETGNVMANSIHKIAPMLHNSTHMTVVNQRSAHGGMARETLTEAIIRARKDRKSTFRAVTTENYETLALVTPGLRVKRARALALFSPGLSGYPQNREDGVVTVIAVPFSNTDKPIPSKGFLKTICRHLSRHRLLATRLHVIGPEYARISIQATAALRKGFSDTVTQNKIEEKLRTFLHPLNGGIDGNGWPFGRSVYKSEIYQVIENVEGVDCVENVSLNGSGSGISRDSQGNIVIPPQSLACAENLQIKVLNPDQACGIGGVKR